LNILKTSHSEGIRICGFVIVRALGTLSLALYMAYPGDIAYCSSH